MTSVRSSARRSFSRKIASRRVSTFSPWIRPLTLSTTIFLLSIVRSILQLIAVDAPRRGRGSTDRRTASRPVAKNPFLRYPLAYIGRTISEFDSSCLADRKQPHRFAIYEDDLRQIERQSAFLSSDHFSKSFHVFSTDSPTHTQHHNLFSIDSSFDPATHRGRCTEAGTRLGISVPFRAAISLADSTVLCTKQHVSHHSETADYK